MFRFVGISEKSEMYLAFTSNYPRWMQSIYFLFQFMHTFLFILLKSHSPSCQHSRHPHRYMLGSSSYFIMKYWRHILHFMARKYSGDFPQRLKSNYIKDANDTYREIIGIPECQQPNSGNSAKTSFIRLLSGNCGFTCFAGSKFQRKWRNFCWISRIFNLAERKWITIYDVAFNSAILNEVMTCRQYD